MFRITTVVTLVTGTMFLMWLGEQITERGIGNGISLIIFAGIAAGLAAGDRRHAGAGAHRRVFDPAGALCIVGAGDRASPRSSCFVERGQRKILVNYAKRQVGQQGLRRPELAPAAQAQHVGRDPADLRLVASSCSRRRCVGWFGSAEGMIWLRDIAGTLHPGPADLRAAVRRGDHFLLLLLHGAAVQPEGDRGQPEEERRVRARHPAGRPDRAATSRRS